jgi:Tfp pilus assembly protein PilF
MESSTLKQMQPHEEEYSVKPERRVFSTAVAALCLGLAAPLTGDAHEASHTTPARLGKVHFKVECNATAQKEFDLAMAYYHSFAWHRYEAPLERVLKADPTCGMAHWARSLAILDNPFIWPGILSPAKLNDAQAALEAARKIGLKSQREHDYVEALAVFFKDHDKSNHRTRAKAFEAAMAEVAGRYPDDQEASILYALVLSANFDPTDRKYTNQLKAAQILEPIFKQQPEHPGIVHYLIHSYDYPPIAHHGLEAARRYARIAPDATHALHMPSHIFTRVGHWRESVEANRASAAAATDTTFDKLHAYDYMVYAHLQLGQDRAARTVIAQARKVPQLVDHFAFAYAFAAMPARVALERGAWKEAANLPLYPANDGYPWKKYPQSEAVNAFARGVGAAMSKDPAAAHAEVKRLHALRDAAAALKIGYWVEQIDIQALIVSGLIAYVEGKQAAGIEDLTKAAEREDATEKHVVTPGPLVPAREVLAQTLLASGKPALALREFEQVLGKEPNRYRAFAGAAQAAERAGDAKKAAFYSARLVEMTESADSPRAEITQARRVLGM